MTEDFIAFGPLGALAGSPKRIQSFLEKYLRFRGNAQQQGYVLCDLSHYIDCFRQWAYRRADGDIRLLAEVDTYVEDLFSLIKNVREQKRFDDIELERLKALKGRLTEKLRDHIPERLISGGQASIKRLLDDIENSEHITTYPPGGSDTWYNAEIERLCLLSEKITLLMRLVRKIHPENADKYHYLHYLGEVTGDIAYYVGGLEQSRDELYASIGKDKIDIAEHFSKIDGSIETASRDIKRHFSELKEHLTASKPLEIHEIVRAFRQYEKSKDISTLPPIRQLYNTLHKLKEPCPEDTSKLADFIIALSRAVRNEVGYHWPMYGPTYELSSAEVLREIESLDTGDQQQPYKELSNNGDNAGDIKATPRPSEEKAYQSYCAAIDKNRELAGKTDKQVYDWLEGNKDTIEPYELPSFYTWGRYVRTGRKHYGTSKNTARAGRTLRTAVSVTDPAANQITSKFQDEDEAD